MTVRCRVQFRFDISCNYTGAKLHSSFLWAISVALTEGRRAASATADLIKNDLICALERA